MSGRPDRTAYLAGAASLRLVQALPIVAERIGAEPALVGGLAVLSHVTTAHRATGDVDVVDSREEVSPSLLEVLLASGARPDGVVGAVVETPSGPVRVDVLDVTDADIARLPDDPTDRLHVLAHHWAATSTERVRLVATSAHDGADAIVRVATPGPIVATKLQSAMNRRRAQQATDLLDVMRLTFDARTADDVVGELGEVSAPLATDALLHARHWFADRAAETLRTLHVVPAGRTYALDDVVTTGRLLTAALGR